MQRKLLGIINVDFDATGQLPNIYSACIKYLEKMGIQRRKLMIQLGGRSCIIFSEFGIPMKLVRLIKMCLNETYSRIQVGKNLYDKFPIRNGLKQDVLLPLVSNYALDYTIRSVQVNQDGLKLNGTHQLLAYADDVYIGTKCTYYKLKCRSFSSC
jgi:hypothetical protein